MVKSRKNLSDFLIFYIVIQLAILLLFVVALLVGLTLYSQPRQQYILHPEHYTLSGIPSRYRLDYLTQPKSPCQRKNIFLGVYVFSVIHNFRQRQAIRETWGGWVRNKDDAFLFFVVGNSRNLIHLELLKMESSIHSDIIQGTFIDSYFNLSMKSIAALQWVHHNCPNANFVLKTDDDVFVHVKYLRQYLYHKRDEKGQIVGQLSRDIGPAEYIEDWWNPSGVKHVTYMYPLYTTGPSYVMFRGVVSSLYRVAHQVPMFVLEDVYTTGFLADEANVTRIPHEGFNLNFENERDCNKRKYISYRSLTPKLIRLLWKGYRNQMRPCEVVAKFMKKKKH